MNEEFSSYFLYGVLVVGILWFLLLFNKEARYSNSAKVISWYLIAIGLAVQVLVLIHMGHRLLQVY